MGHPPLWLPWTEPFILQHRGGEENRSARFEAGDCPSREWRLGVCGLRWCVRRYFNGLYTVGGPDDGYAQRLDRPRYTHLPFTAKGAERGRARQRSEPQIRFTW